MSYKQGFADGWNAAMERFGPHEEDLDERAERSQFMGAIRPAVRMKRKRARSAVQKLLDDMAATAWKKYRRTSPKGKKSYMDIRSRVSRSMEYKKKAKRMKK